jgi:hypothetical protein
MSETTANLVAYVEKRAGAFSKKLKCPNHSEGIAFERFKEASNVLAEPFSKAVDKYHASKWN